MNLCFYSSCLLESASHLFPGSFTYPAGIYCIPVSSRLRPECGAGSEKPQGQPLLSIASLLWSLSQASRRDRWVMKHGLWCGWTLHGGSSGPPRVYVQEFMVTATCISEHACSKSWEFPFAEGKLRLTKIRESEEPFQFSSL